MKTTLPVLTVVLLSMTSCRSSQETQSIQDPRAPSPATNLSVVPWPDGKAPDRFMAGLKLVSLPAEDARKIVEKARPSEEPHLKPDFKTPLAAAQYFGTHLNMVEPPKYMAVHTDSKGKKYYLFSGGRHWARLPVFSHTSVLLETGEIRFYEEDDQPKN